jgi:hypothetical protein
VDRYRTIFRSLRALQVSSWQPAVLQAKPTRTAGTTKAGTRATHGTSTTDGTSTTPIAARIELAYCLATPSCPHRQPTAKNSSHIVDTTWEWRAGALVLSNETADGHQRLPFESELVSATGNRVIVAATAGLADQLPQAVAAADQAATAADRYARWRPAPNKYVVYLAAPNEWTSWFGGHAGDAQGYAIQSGTASIEVVVDATHIRPDLLTRVLQHEFGHVVTLPDKHVADHWWLTEGIAEYVAFAGRPVSSYDLLDDTRRFIHSGRWNGHVGLDAAPHDPYTAGGYGVAYLSLFCLSSHFGEERMLAFYAAANRDLMSLETASRTKLGTPWAQVDADCAAFIRAATNT